METGSYCVGGRHHSSTKIISGDLAHKCRKLLFGYCSICNKKKALTVSGNTNATKGLSDSFKKLGKERFVASRKMANIVLKNPGRALEIGTNPGSDFPSRNPKAALSSLPERMKFYHIRKKM